MKVGSKKTSKNKILDLFSKKLLRETKKQNLAPISGKGNEDDLIKDFNKIPS